MDFTKLESRRYIGSKTKLAEWIFKHIEEEICGANVFFDVFAGTGIISKEASKYYNKIIINDFLKSNYISYNAFFNKPINIKFIDKKILEYNNLNPNEINDNYFSKNFANKYFTEENSKIIGYIRDDIENIKKEISLLDYYTLITILLYSMDKVANTVGHYDAYIKKEIKSNRIKLHPLEHIRANKIEIFMEEANNLVNQIYTDIAYIDPPYNSRQYGRFYHIWENIAEWNKPQLYGTALKPEPTKVSEYCKTSAKDAFEDLINKLNTKYIVVSYNNTYKSKSSSSKNKINLEEIKQILSQKGETKIFEQEHKFFNAGKTDFTDHKEFLFITKVNNK